MPVRAPIGRRGRAGLWRQGHAAAAIRGSAENQARVAMNRASQKDKQLGSNPAHRLRLAEDEPGAVEAVDVGTEMGAAVFAGIQKVIDRLATPGR
jgi:hypothetical protein